MTHALAIDTTSDFLSLGVVRNDTMAGCHYAFCGTRIARTILPEIESMLSSAGLQPGALDLLVVNRGPGSFTGTRIGMSVAITLGRVLGKPVVGVDSLQVLAAQVDPAFSAPFHVLLNCTRDEVYQAVYRWDQTRVVAVTEIRLTTLDLAAREIAGAPCLLRRFDSSPAASAAPFAGFAPVPLRHPLPDAARLLDVGLRQYGTHGGDAFETPAPLYLKSEAFRKWVPPAGVKA